MLAITATSLFISAGANAANLISADVTGPSGTIWTTRDTGNYTLFVQTPGLGDFLNPNDEALNVTPTEGANRFLLAGEGFRPGETANSDAIYTVTLGFADGATISGTYTPALNNFIGGTTATVGNTTYALTKFSFTRTLGDSVSPNVAFPGGNSHDYSGNFTFDVTTAAVPEPAAWALMIGGFGIVGGAMRRRVTRMTYA
ncbi:PEPxxWA-CTERM sorting domain-containing protein [Sphingomonas sp. 1P06PA]|uniref:PEPxxWA-CTERM sorting domain-containing protein n=1 Tax=Sphingomonas sp. 1P06PA TaxID=554121 RepID=UPI0039A433B8